MQPILKEKIWTGRRGEGHAKYRLQAVGGLHYIKGNKLPYFTLTGSMDHKTGRGWRSIVCGCIHEELVKAWPSLRTLAALHLADIDGAPSHAEANGWYQLAGACGGLGEEYHAAQSDGWQTRTEHGALLGFAAHCRISEAEAELIKKDVLNVYTGGGPGRFQDANPKAARALWRTICDGMRPRWKREAEDAIKFYGLTIFGDAYEAQEAANA